MNIVLFIARTLCRTRQSACSVAGVTSVLDVISSYTCTCTCVYMYIVRACMTTALFCVYINVHVQYMLLCMFVYMHILHLLAYVSETLPQTLTQPDLFKEAIQYVLPKSLLEPIYHCFYYFEAMNVSHYIYMYILYV